ncbi:glycosyltransferase [Streptomyces sp. NPDC006261]|uniref:glycosyltransferase n=1 Tax=Streptomyces sp. NPDC006261 TaxID=3156739 RepID=UPI0033B29A1B
MEVGDLLFYFVVFYPVATSAVWIAGGLLFRLLEERRVIHPPAGGWPAVTVLVPAYNEEAVIARCVQALLRVDYPELEVLILNDGSSDATVRAAVEAAAGDPRVSVLDDEVNLGKADRLNEGMRRARHELVVVTDADTHLHPDAVKYLVERITRSRRYAAVAGAPFVTNRRNVLSAMQVLEAASLIGLIRRTHALAGRVGTVAGVLGIFRRDAVLAVGGYDPRMATEDIELTWRLLEAGYRTSFEPNALVGMEVPLTLRSLWKQRTRWARGQGEVVRTHGRKMFRPGSVDLWPIAWEAVLSYVWVLVLMGGTLWELVRLVVFHSTGEVAWMLSWGVAIAIISTVQLTVATSIVYARDPTLSRAYLLGPVYPLCHWAINALAALFSQTVGLLRGPRQRRVTWNIQREGDGGPPA